jgi:trans-aconitate methyltransferase
MAETGRTYLPAAGYHWSLALYDPIVKLLGGDAARAMLVEQAALRPGHRALDIGCGTGSLLVLIKDKYPNVEVVGLDPDPRALARARRKVSEPDFHSNSIKASRISCHTRMALLIACSRRLCFTTWKTRAGRERCAKCVAS